MARPAQAALLINLIFASVTVCAVFGEEPTGRFAKMYEVTAASAIVEPGEPFSTITVEATGRVNTGGWADPELAAWSYIEAPSDGILDFDLMARMPPDDAMVTMALEDLSASVSGPMPPWVRGVRIHASSNATEVLLDGMASLSSLPGSEAGSEGDIATDEVLPWPWKFFTPDADE